MEDVKTFLPRVTRTTPSAGRGQRRLRSGSLVERIRRRFPGAEIVECSLHTVRIPKTPENMEKLWRMGWPGIATLGRE